MNQRKKLPIGIQTFSEIRSKERNYTYVDKTELCYQLIDNGKYYFLSRPRRFGKSLFLDTLAEIFNGSKDLFEGLHIYDKWNWEENFPVARIDLGTGNFSDEAGIKHRLRSVLEFNCELLGLDVQRCTDIDEGEFLAKLIREAHARFGRQAVVLIDEYDKPILDNITKREVAATARDILRTFYSTLKSNDAFLRFVFITGVSKFSKLNLFSGLNNIDDITIDKRYATITGYTHHDLQTVFSDYVQDVDQEEVRRWYNGYNYFGEPVYNPYDILLFFSRGNEFENYWWETGNPSFLIDKLKEDPQHLPQLENVEMNKTTLSAFDVEHIELSALLWQTGYLTFASKETLLGTPIYKLKVPNKEVQLSLNALFFDYLTKIGNNTTLKTSTAKLFLKADFGGIRKQLVALFAAIPYSNYANNIIARFEGYYASVIYAFLSSLGFDVRTEDHSNTGRADMTLIGPDQIFVLEFKVDMPAEAALEQIRTKRYHEKYIAQGKAIYLIGIHFDSTERNITGFEWEAFA